MFVLRHCAATCEVAAGDPFRRLFREPAGAEQWLGEILSPAEAADANFDLRRRALSAKR